MGNILFTLSYRQRYCTAYEQPRDLVLLYRRDNFKPAYTLRANWEVYLIIKEDFQASDVKYNDGVHTHTHTLDCSLWYGNYTDSTTEASISFYTLSTMLKGKMILLFLMDVHVHIFSQIMTRVLPRRAHWWWRMSAGSHSTWYGVRQASLPTISTCMVSYRTPWATGKTWRMRVPSDPLLCPRLSGASQHSHDYSGGLPLCCVHRPDPAGCVESARVRPRP